MAAGAFTARVALKPKRSTARSGADRGLDTSTCIPRSTATRDWRTRKPPHDEKGITAVEFLARARDWFAAHGIVAIERIVTDNGACYRSQAFAAALDGSRHQRITPYTPRHNGKIERYNRILAEDFLYARAWSSEQQRRDGLLT